MSSGKSISMFECLLIDKCSCCAVDNGQGTVSDEKRSERFKQAPSSTVLLTAAVPNTAVVATSETYFQP